MTRRGEKKETQSSVSDRSDSVLSDLSGLTWSDHGLILTLSIICSERGLPSRSRLGKGQPLGGARGERSERDRVCVSESESERECVRDSVCERLCVRE